MKRLAKSLSSHPSSALPFAPPSVFAKATPGQVRRTSGRTEAGSALPLRELNLLGRLHGCSRIVLRAFLSPIRVNPCNPWSNIRLTVANHQPLIDCSRGRNTTGQEPVTLQTDNGHRNLGHMNKRNALWSRFLCPPFLCHFSSDRTSRPPTPDRRRGFDCGSRLWRSWRQELEAGQALGGTPCSSSCS